MTDDSRDDMKTNPTSEKTTTTPVARLGIGRGKPRPELNSEPALPQSTMPLKWNSSNNGSSESFWGTRNNKNNYNANERNVNEEGGSSSNNHFSDRGGFGNSGRGGFPSNHGNSPRECFNCHKTGHIARECPEPRKENYSANGDGNRGGFNSNRGQGRVNSGSSRGEFHSSGERNFSRFNPSGGDRSSFQSSGNDFNSNNTNRSVYAVPSSNNGSSSMSITVPNSRNPSDNDSRPTISTWREGTANRTNNRNEYEESSKSVTFVNSSRSSGFRGGQHGSNGRFYSGDHGNHGGSGNNNCFNCDKPGHQSRECPEERKPRNNVGNTLNYASGHRNNNRESDGSFNQHGPPMERYIPPPVPKTEDEIFGEALSKGENFEKYHTAEVQCTPANRVQPIELFEEAKLGTQLLSNIHRALSGEPTAIQRYTIPCIRQQDDIMACAQTGSGKTAAFLLPIISNLLEYHLDELDQKHNPPAPLCLIVSPTRELALQTDSEARKFAFETPIKSCAVVGGHDTNTVFNRLVDGCHIVSATTGRLKDMVEKGRLSLRKVKYFVLDEADRMLDEGFEPDIRALEDLGLPPKDERYTSMFSATLRGEIRKLARQYLRSDCVSLTVGKPGGANEDITQTIEEVPLSQKKDRLMQLLDQNLKKERCLIFVETKRSADYIGALLSQKNLMSTTMHGDRTQSQRIQAVQDFKSGKCPILVATSVAARGLDFPLIGYVINFDLPDTSDFYIHRIGRTGRAGHLGKSISFFDANRESDRRIAPELVKNLIEAGQTVPKFLEQYIDDASTDFDRKGQDSRNIDMRTGHKPFLNRNQAFGSTGGTASAGAAQENWD